MKTTCIFFQLPSTFGLQSRVQNQGIFLFIYFIKIKRNVDDRVNVELKH